MDLEANDAPPINLVLLGATGSIGESTLRVIDKHRSRIRLVGIAGRRNCAKLAQIAKRYRVPHVCIFEEGAFMQAQSDGIFPSETQIHAGQAGLETLAALPEADTTLVAIVGIHGLLPALRAIEAKKRLAVASKEILVLAGKFITAAAKRHGCAILPVDSEHNAIYQCLDPNPQDASARPSVENVRKITLTASGGAFRDLPTSAFPRVTLEQALKHPNWEMGPKVTIDAATMANKGLEMIEARWLFGLEPEQVDAVVHPQSLVHSFVEYIDGSVLAQICPHDMTFAIQHCLLHPQRAAPVAAPLDFSRALRMDFAPPDLRRYPCFSLARHAMQSAGVAPAIFNAANEVAVEAFVAGKLKFVEIAPLIEKTLEVIDNWEPSSLSEALDADQLARQVATRQLPS